METELVKRPVEELDPPYRLLLGPGPANPHPTVARALSAPIVGYLDPYLMKVMDESSQMLRAVFQTANRMTLAVSGTGHGGMEACIRLTVGPGDGIIVGVNGFFGQRIADMARRCGATVTPVAAEWGRIVEPDTIARAIREHPEAKVVAVVHAETSTGVLQPVEEIGRIVRAADKVFLLDCVTSLGGVAVKLDEWNVDLAYSCSQKCLGVVPGLAPVSVNERALALAAARPNRDQGYYLDLELLARYWSTERMYHHTGPANLFYALHEALRLIFEERPDLRFRRHRVHGEALQVGIEAMGLTLHAEAGYRLPVLTTVRVPEGVDDGAVRRVLLETYGIEIAGGLGDLRGRIWRIGLMGYNAAESNVLVLLGALEEALRRAGQPVEAGAGVRAASDFYRSC